MILSCFDVEKVVILELPVILSCFDVEKVVILELPVILYL